MSKKYTIRAVSDNEVYVDYHDAEYPYTRNYRAPTVGGYVYDITDEPETPRHQVCNGMGRLGATLHYQEGTQLGEMLEFELRTWARRN